MGRFMSWYIDIGEGNEVGIDIGVAWQKFGIMRFNLEVKLQIPSQELSLHSCMQYHIHVI